MLHRRCLDLQRRGSDASKSKLQASTSKRFDPTSQQSASTLKQKASPPWLGNSARGAGSFDDGENFIIAAASEPRRRGNSDHRRCSRRHVLSVEQQIQGKGSACPPHKQKNRPACADRFFVFFPYCMPWQARKIRQLFDRYGGRCRVRTCDPCRVKAMLYR